MMDPMAQIGKFIRIARLKLKEHANELMDRGSPLEKALREATANTNWGCPTTLLNEIPRATYDHVDYYVIVRWTLGGLVDKPSRWRKIFKSLTLLEYLIRNGSEKIVEEAGDSLCQNRLRSLMSFHYTEQGADKGAGIRKKAKALCELVNNFELLKEEREKAKKTREKYIGIGPHGQISGPGYTYQTRMKQTEERYDPWETSRGEISKADDSTTQSFVEGADFGFGKPEKFSAEQEQAKKERQRARKERERQRTKAQKEKSYRISKTNKQAHDSREHDSMSTSFSSSSDKYSDVLSSPDQKSRQHKTWRKKTHKKRRSNKETSLSSLSSSQSSSYSTHKSIKRREPKNNHLVDLEDYSDWKAFEDAEPVFPPQQIPGQFIMQPKQQFQVPRNFVEAKPSGNVYANVGFPNSSQPVGDLVHGFQNFSINASVGPAAFQQCDRSTPFQFSYLQSGGLGRPYL